MKIIYLSLFIFSSVSFSGPLSRTVEPAGIRYLPHLCFSKKALELMTPSKSSNEQKEQCKRLLYEKDEKQAKIAFTEKWTIETVGYGYPEGMNCGLFAKKSIDKGEVVGIYSGAGYVRKHPELKNLINFIFLAENKEIKKPEAIINLCLSQFSKKAIEDIVCQLDFKTWADAVSSQLEPLDSLTKKTVFKYLHVMPSKKGSAIDLIPFKGSYAPTHFVNSCNNPDEDNVDLKVLDLGIDKKSKVRICVPCYISTKNISEGEEVLAYYLRDEDTRNSFKETAKKEKYRHTEEVSERQRFVTELNSRLPDDKKIETNDNDYIQSFCMEEMKP